MELSDKLFALAFAPSATEGEAINAFLAIRKNPESLKRFSAPVVKEKAKSTWDMNIPAKVFDAWHHAMQAWKEDEPFFVIKKTGERDRIIDTWKIKFTVHLENEDELERFSDYLDRVFIHLKN